VEAEVVRWDRGGTKPAGEYKIFNGKRNENHELGTDFTYRIYQQLRRYSL
jgi:hypothetical protein